MTVIEKVARAIAFSSGAAIVGPGQSRASREFGWGGDGAHFDKYVERHWRNYIHAATFALEAVKRSATDKMRHEFNGLLNLCPNDVDTFETVWARLMDTALAECPPEKSENAA